MTGPTCAERDFRRGAAHAGEAFLNQASQLGGRLTTEQLGRSADLIEEMRSTGEGSFSFADMLLKRVLREFGEASK